MVKKKEDCNWCMGTQHIERRIADGQPEEYRRRCSACHEAWAEEHYQCDGCGRWIAWDEEPFERDEARDRIYCGGACRGRDVETSPSPKTVIGPSPDFLDFEEYDRDAVDVAFSESVAAKWGNRQGNASVGDRRSNSWKNSLAEHAAWLMTLGGFGLSYAGKLACVTPLALGGLPVATLGAFLLLRARLAGSRRHQLAKLERRRGMSVGKLVDGYVDLGYLIDKNSRGWAKVVVSGSGSEESLEIDVDQVLGGHADGTEAKK